MTGKYRRIVILTGSGLSAESGIATFRDKDGIWSKYDISEVATPEAFARNPQRVHDFYNQRRRGHATVKPNAAHLALARLECEHVAHGGSLLVVTQNIDALHEAAGSRNLIHMHGELLKVQCVSCRSVLGWTSDLSVDDACPGCRVAGALRPDVVWFGEMPYRMDEIEAALSLCDLFISIGTSGAVYPAGGFVREARRAGAHTIELNLEPSECISAFHEAIHGRATQVVPAYVEQLLADRI